MSRSGRPAADLVNSSPNASWQTCCSNLAKSVRRGGMRCLVAARAEAPITTTGRLAAIIRCVLPPDRSGIDPATRSFQALRIGVNDELGEVARALAQASELLSPGGRLVVVSFHSLEDRIVKRFMSRGGRSRPRHLGGMIRAALPAVLRLASVCSPFGPLRPTAAETTANPRARSARLRAMERLAA